MKKNEETKESVEETKERLAENIKFIYFYSPENISFIDKLAKTEQT